MRSTMSPGAKSISAKSESPSKNKRPSIVVRRETIKLKSGALRLNETKGAAANPIASRKKVFILVTVFISDPHYNIFDYPITAFVFRLRFGTKFLQQSPHNAPAKSKCRVLQKQMLGERAVFVVVVKV